MNPEVLKEKEIEQDLVIERGSIIKTYNKAAKREFWSLVLAFNNDMLNCVKLTSDPLFSKIPEIGVTTKFTGLNDENPIYVNAFGGFFNIRYDQVIEVLGKVTLPEYYGVISTISNYFLGFWYLDEEDGCYKIDVPYVRNPLFTMCFGMVTLDEAKRSAAANALNITKKIEKEKRKKIENKIDNLPYLSRTDNAKNLLASLSVYSLDTQDRINAIYRVFGKFLTHDGKLNVSMAHNAIFYGKAPMKSRGGRGNRTLSKEEFANYLNSGAGELDDMANSSNTIRIIKKLVTDIYTGKNSKNRKVPHEIREFITSESDTGKSIVDISNDLSSKFGIDFPDAQAMTKNVVVNGRHKKAVAEKGIKPVANTPARKVDDKLLSCLDYGWIKSFDKFKELTDYITSVYDKTPLINDGSFIVDTGDPVMDMIVLHIIFRSTSFRTWFRFLELPAYSRLIDYINTQTLRDISKRFDKDPSFYTCPIVNIKAIAKAMRLSKEELEWYTKLFKAKNINGFRHENIQPHICHMLSNPTRHSKSMLRMLTKYFGVNNISELSNLVELASKSNITYFSISDII